MRFLFVHDAFPGQFTHLFRHLQRAGHEVIAASREGSTLKLPVEQVVYGVPEGLIAKGEKLAPRMAAVVLGHDLYEKLKPLKRDGRAPDYIISHASHGATYFLKDLFPQARFTAFLEWYYRDAPPGSARDLPAYLKTCAANAMRNGVIMRDFEQADAAYAPTEYQRSQFPDKWQPSIKVIHEGIDTARYKPSPDAQLKIGDKLFTSDMELVTYGARGMEKARGFPQFMQAVAAAQKSRPNLHVLIAAADRLCYDQRGGKKGLKGWVDENVDYDRARTHFLGLLPERDFITMLQVSSLHVYLTIPFVLSWSCLNAMSTGTPVLGSATAPVEEVIRDGENGFLVPLTDPGAIAGRMTELLENPGELNAVRPAARQTILDRFDLEACMEAQLALIQGAD